MVALSHDRLTWEVRQSGKQTEKDSGNPRDNVRVNGINSLVLVYPSDKKGLKCLFYVKY